MSTGRSEDEAWRSIVENYGERALVDDAAPAAPEPAPEPVTEPVSEPVPDDEPEDVAEERFVPPVPPPAPRLPARQRWAWLGVLGTPVLLLLALLTGTSVPPLLGYVLVAAFVGGFLYLVATMQRSDGRDPFDDGARL